MNTVQRLLWLQCRAYTCYARAQVEEALAEFWAKHAPEAAEGGLCRARARGAREDGDRYMRSARELARRIGAPALVDVPVWYPDKESHT